MATQSFLFHIRLSAVYIAVILLVILIIIIITITITIVIIITCSLVEINKLKISDLSAFLFILKFGFKT